MKKNNINFNIFGFSINRVSTYFVLFYILLISMRFEIYSRFFLTTGVYYLVVNYIAYKLPLPSKLKINISIFRKCSYLAAFIFIYYHATLQSDERWEFITALVRFELYDDISSLGLPSLSTCLYVIEVFCIWVITFSPLITFETEMEEYDSLMKRKLFSVLRRKFKIKFRLKKPPKFDSLLKSISLYNLTDSRIRKQITQNKGEKNISYSSSIFLFDCLYFPKKGLYICQSRISVQVAHFKKMQWIGPVDPDEEGWYLSARSPDIFNGVIIMKNKLLEETSKNRRSKFFKIDNEESNEKEKRLAFNTLDNDPVFRAPNFRQSTIFAEESKDIKKEYGTKLDTCDPVPGLLFELTAKKIKSFGSFENIENFDNINKSLSKIAKELNIDYILEDNNMTYLFHKFKVHNRRLFECSRNETNSFNKEKFEKDFKFILEIIEKF